jgi:hypothetical protein
MNLFEGPGQQAGEQKPPALLTDSEATRWAACLSLLEELVE